MKPSVSVQRIVFGANPSLVRATKDPNPLDPARNNIGLPEPETVAGVDMVKLLQGRIWELYSAKACLKEPDYEAVYKTKKRLPVK